MLLSRQNFEICKIAEQDKGIPVLNQIHFDEHGASMSANSKSFVVMSSIPDTIKNNLPLGPGDELEEFSLSIGLCKELIRSMPPDTSFGGLTENTSVTDNGSELEFTTTDGKRKKTLTGKKFERKWIEYKGFLRKIFSKNKKIKVILNRKRLLSMLTVIESTCQDKTGHSLLYLEIDNEDNLVLRSFNPRNGQHISGFLSSYKSDEEDWIQDDNWEKRFSEMAKVSRLK